MLIVMRKPIKGSGGPLDIVQFFFFLTHLSQILQQNKIADN